MGDSVSKPMVKNQREIQLKQREMQMAMNRAFARDLLNWLAALSGTIAVGATVGFVKKRTPVGFIPLVPLSFVMGYQYDLAYGNKMERIRTMTEQILTEENAKGMDSMLVPPSNQRMVTLEEYQQIFYPKPKDMPTKK
eukprot:TRINITY_DN118110_c0_g1_i1.p1 TRINITY_DN118110_c0_g1~~TRINITY_DN118110_c0_g1_i1.p1  ORF type:complete len:154 (+),score=7.71 TRINITY_DN118110_c0_g1_i1:51-464(+)